jgi:hypothetical protein
VTGNKLNQLEAIKVVKKEYSPKVAGLEYKNPHQNSSYCSIPVQPA